MKTLVLALVVIPAVAAAQPGNYYAAPPPAQPPPAPAVVDAPPKAHLDVAIIAASPQSELEEQLQVETSPGFQLQVGLFVAPNISLFAGLRYVRMNYDEQALGTSDIRLSHRELQVGARFTTPIAPTAKLFLEGNLHSATLEASFQGDSQSESGVGIGVRAGVMVMVDRKIGLGLAVGYSSADIEADDGDGGDNGIEDAWLTGDAGLSFFF